MTTIERLIPLAIVVIKETGIANEQLKVNAEFKGYFASFGASIIQSGLLPAVIFFENEEGSARADRKKVPQAMLYLMEKQENNELVFDEHKKLSSLILEQQFNAILLRKVTNAAVALKIALRTYHLIKKEKTPSSNA